MRGFSRREAVQIISGAAIAAIAAHASGALGAPRTRAIQIFGHRGASALRPEHTLASYQKAIEDGADYIEPDLVCTKDGVLVARHENNISQTTDVASRLPFAARKVTKIVDGQKQDGWFVEDFTLAELKTLRAIERLPQLRPENAKFDGQFDVPTFAEIIALTASQSIKHGRVVGLVPELKHSTYFKGIGLPLEDRFLGELAAHEYTRRCPLEIQSFEITNLKYLRGKIGRRNNIRLMQLVEPAAGKPADVVAAGSGPSYADMVTPAGLAAVAAYADVIAPPVRSIIPLDADGRLTQPTTLVADAHRAGLLVHIWTFRPENYFLAADFREGSDPAHRNVAGSIREIQAYVRTGIDGFFSDDPGIGRQALATL